MLRLGVGVILMGLAAGAQAVQQEDDFFAPKLNLLTTRFVHFGTDSIPIYQFSASVMSARLPVAMSNGSEFGNPSPLPVVVKPQQEVVREINLHWYQAYDGDRISLPRLLRAEFKFAQVNIALRPHSVSIDGERVKLTFRSRSALFEEGQFKLILQPHTTSMMWSKAF